MVYKRQADKLLLADEPKVTIASIEHEGAPLVYKPPFCPFSYRLLDALCLLVAVACVTFIFPSYFSATYSLWCRSIGTALSTAVPSANVQSLVQLAAALNAGYFAFQAANSTYYGNIHSLLNMLAATLTERRARLPASSSSRADILEYQAQILDYLNTLTARTISYATFNRAARYVGYSNFIFMCLYLACLAIWSHVPCYTAVSICALGYIPLILAVVVETKRTWIFASIENGVIALRQKVSASF